MKEYKIDAKGKILGRVASETASILRGKSNVDFAPNRVPDLKLTVDNLKDIKVSGKKMKQKEYFRHSGYPGGLKKINLANLIEKKGLVFVFKETVMGMLPKTKLRKGMMSNLTINE